jgi:o-succinylbenzoate---CoA ligase
MTACPIRTAAERFPDSPAVVWRDGSWSYAEYDERIQRVAASLGQRGIAHGDVVALRSPASPGFIAAYMGAIRAGAIPCPLSTRLPQAAVDERFDAVGAKCVLNEDEFSTLIANSSQSAPETFVVDADQPATLVFTSGSSGEPKAALHGIRNHMANALASNRIIPLEPGDRWLLSLPLFHVAGIAVLFRCACAGATVAVPAHDDDLAHAIVDLGVSHVSLVATQLQRLLDTEANALAGLKAILLGGSPLPPRLVRRAVDADLPVFTTYGMTETASQIATTRAAVEKHELVTAAPPIIPDTLRIADDGEILVSGPTLFAGYWRRGEIELPLTADGWFQTGDLGELDDHGRLAVRGRKDTMFISGGENIHPEEIERRLLACVGVEQAVVVPVESTEYGQRPVAFVQTSPDSSKTQDELRTALAHDLPGFMIPVAFHPWPDDLAAQGIKVSRALLAERARDLTSHR